MDRDVEADWKHHYDQLAARMSNIERAFFGFLDPDTNEFRSGLLQNTADAAKSITETAASVEEVKRWLKFGAIAFILLLVATAFPRLWQILSQLLKVAV